MSEISHAKIFPPQMKNSIIERPRLLKLLRGFDERKVTLLAAPAGYGKTVLMQQLAGAVESPLAWYQLDGYDNDPAVFLQCLAAGLETHIPDFGRQIKQLMEGGGVETRLRLLVATIVNKLSQQVTHPLLLFFDDYHTISAPAVHNFLQDLLEHLPVHVHVVIASRTLPPLNFTRLQAAGEMMTIGNKELRFSDEEMRTFLAERAAQLPDKTRKLLEQKVDGWPVAVQLAIDAAVDVSPLNLDDGTAGIYAYLATEVLTRQPENIKEFLLTTAVLDVLTADNCNLLLKRDDSAATLAFLETQNLLLIPLSGTPKSYLYHQLFRDFLLDQLGEERRHWQRAAGDIARERGDLAAAIEYFIMAEAENELIAVLKEAGQQAFRQGRWQTVIRWLACLPEHKLAADPWLALFQARIKTHQGHMDQAARWVKQAADLFAAEEHRPGLAETQLLQARLFRNRGFYAQSLELLEKASPYLITQNDHPRFDLPLEKSIALVMTGRYKDAEDLLYGALAEAEKAKDSCVIVYILEGLGNLYFLQGEYEKALQAHRKRLQFAPVKHLPAYYCEDYAAWIYEDWGELDQAYANAKQSVAIKENLGLTEALPSAYCKLACTYFSQGNLQEAEQCFRKAIHLIMENNGDLLFRIVNKAHLALCLSQQNRLPEAQQLAEETLREAQTPGGLVLALSQVLVAPIFLMNSQIQTALEILSAGTRVLEKLNFFRGLCKAYAVFAMFHAATGAKAEAAQYAAKLLALTAPKNIIQEFLTAYEIFRPILQIGIVQGIETTFVQRVFSRLGKRALPQLRELAGHPDPEVRHRIILPLAEIGTSQAMALLQTLALDKHPEVRQLAAERLRQLEAELPCILITPPPVTALAINTLGSFQLVRGGNETAAINWRTAKTRDLLAFLVHQEKPVAKETIMEELWPDYVPEKSQNLFHTNLYYLRQVLDKLGYPNLIIYRNKLYELDGQIYTTDHAQFQQLIKAGLNEENPPEKACGFLERAATLYHGNYLAELDYGWLLPCREYLKNLNFTARLRLARHYLAQLNYHQAICHLRVLTDLNPLSEELHQLLMTAYAGLGDLTAVRDQYQALSALFQKEANLPLHPETHNLYRRLCGISDPEH